MKTLLSSFTLWAVLLMGFFGSAQCPTDLHLYSQIDVDNFATNYPGCTQIPGNLTIENTNITSVAGLNGITHVGGYLQIIGTANLANLDGLSSLVSVGSYIDIYLNSALTDISGLGNIVFQPGFWGIVIEDNTALSICNVPNFCNHFASPSPMSRIIGNATGCATIPQLRSACITPDANGILYVKKGSMGSGASWSDALGEVSDALAEAQTDLSITQIWVAKGTYSATGTGLRMRNNLAIYGGFDPENGIDDLTDKRISPSPTNGSILTGDNVRRVVTNIFTNASPLNDTAVLDGFTITKGNPPHTQQQFDMTDSGGGIININASPKLVNLFVFDNYANDRGGGIYNNTSSPTIVNTVVARNRSHYSGGGIYNLASPVNIINSTVVYNQSERVGGIRNNGLLSQLVVKNTIVYGNTKTITNDPEDRNLSNIANGTSTITHSFLQNVTTADAQGNVDGSIDSFFINTTANNFRLLQCSPLLNAGSNMAFAPAQIPNIASITNDLDGNPRIQNTLVDLGAYENSGNVLTTLYVDITATGSNDGTSWANAYTSFAEAVVAAHKCMEVTQILVAEGTYYPEYAIDYRSLNPVVVHPRNLAFVFTRGNLEILGGYPNGGGTRNWKLHPTILSGNIGDPSDTTDDALHVMITVTSAVNNSFVFDGFTVTNGYANSSSSLDVLGYSIPLDQGGGWYNLNGSPKINNTIISENTASTRGGGWYNNNGSPIITNTIISENYAFARGGGWYNNHGNPQLTNTIICENRANGYGSGWQNEIGNPILTNCTIAGNKGSIDWEGWRNEGGNPVITNSIIYANGSGINVISGLPVISYSLIEGLAGTANGNLNGVTTNPLFRGPIDALPTDTPADNYRLMRCSPALNVGNNTVYTNGQTPDLSAIITDVDVNPRIQNLANGGVVDLGAYEKLDTTSPSGTLYVDAAATGANDGSSWSNAFTSLSKAVLLANSCTDITQILVAEGTYYPEYTGSYMHVNQESSSRNFSFVFTRGGLEVLGGYPNGGGNRDWIAHPTILNGNIENTPFVADDVFHVLITVGTDNTFILDGFTITNGCAGTVDVIEIFGYYIYHAGGGGWYNHNGNPTIKNLIITQNHGALGGGVYNNGSPAVDNIIVTENSGSVCAGWYNQEGNPVIRSATFSGNNGRGWYNATGNPLIINSLISGNKNNSNGGGWYNYSGDSKLINTTITGNLANNGGGFYYVAGNPSITNSIIYGNQATTNPQINMIGALPTISYSLVEGQSSTTNGNLNGVTNNPLFVAPAPASDAPTTAGNYRLTRCSPLIDNGNNTVYAIGQTPDLSAIITDLDENPRIQNSIVDLGAYEIESTSATIRYVDGMATGNNDGTSWANAFTNLQMGINTACSGDQVWVAKGEYQPALNASFRMKEGVKIYGGFAGTETTLSQRNLNTNKTVLKGNNNSVIVNDFTAGSPMTDASVLDGFTITGGLIAGTGGGIRNLYASPMLINLTITNNYAERGGGIYNANSNPTLINTIIARNRTTLYDGGGMYNSESSPLIINSSIVYNISYDGSGITNASGPRPPVVFKNSIVYGNFRVSSFGSGDLNLSNLFNAATTFQHSYAQNITTADAQGNVAGTLDPLFIDVFVNFRLAPCSPLINKGSNTVFSPGQTPDLSAITTDIEGDPRIQNTLVDLGAYENIETPINATLYVDGTATGNNDGTSWADAYTSLADAIALAHKCTVVNQILVAEGTYYPKYADPFLAGNSATLVSPRSNAFNFRRSGLEVLGGYPSGGGTRDWTQHLTILSGNIGDPAVDTDNNFHVVATFGNLGGAPKIDGFTVTKGYANNLGGAGGGWYNNNGNPIISNVIISGNYGDSGGGFYNSPGIPILTNVIITGNNAIYGGGFYSINGNATLNNVTISGNRASNSGGGVVSASGPMTINNTILYGNEAPTYPGIFKHAATTPLSVSHSLIQGLSSTANGNLDGLTTNPQFVAPAPASAAPTMAGDYRLARCSPLIDKGNNIFFSAGQTPDLSAITTDLDGNPRIQNTVIDIGAYENRSTPQIIYVNKNATGTNLGTSWQDAFTDFQTGVNTACSDDQVWVAQGEYQPVLNNYFRMKEGVKIYGGFAGTETLLSERNWHTNNTILKGNNNSVIRNEFTAASPMTNASMLNGFTIKDGLANQSPNPENILDTGGGIFNLYASPQLINLIITNNTADDRGGGIYNRFSNPLLVNSVIARNRANRSGGGIYNYSSASRLVNSTLVYNTADRAGGIRSNYAQSAVILQNTIVYANTQNQATLPEQANIANLDGATITYSHSFVQNVTTNDAQGNVDGTLIPLFASISNNNFRLLQCSPLINKGTATVFAPAQTPDLSTITTDLDGNTRIQESVVDLGAYENSGNILTTLYVDITANGNNDGSSWTDAYTSFAEAVIVAHKCTEINQILVAEGTYYPEYGQYLDFTASSSREKCFLFRRGSLKVLGGYPNGGGARDSSLHPTILSGNIGNPAIDTDNTYHIVITYSPAVDQTFIFDGFSITKSNGNNPNQSLVANGDGGGWNNEYGSPVITNVIISGNYADRGAGFFNAIGNPTLTNVIINGNSGIYGGGFYNALGNALLTNTTISGNYASSYGGGIRKSNGNLIIRNSIIYGNNAPTSPGIYQTGALPTISYSLVQGLSSTANGNIDGVANNPQFVAPITTTTPTSAGNYRLQANSPVIDAANSSLIPATITTDLDGNNRIMGLSADMGAYEYQGARCDYTTTWNGATWSNGLPDADTKIIFDGDYTSDALNTNAGVLEGCSLEVVSGLIVISEGHQLIIDNEVTIAGYDFFLKNNASLVQIQDNAINKGTLTYERTTPPIYRYDYVYWSSPVTEDSNFLLGRNPADIYQHGLSRGTMFDKFHSWDTDEQAWSTILYGNEAMVPGKGYIVRAPQSYGTDPLNPASYNTFTGEFVGKPNNGLISIPIAGGQNQWNLIGNPYPSALYVDEFLHQNNTAVDGTIYIWTHATAIANGGSGNIYSYDAGDYASYNLSGGVGTGAGTDAPNGSSIPSGYIASGQSFFIKGSAIGGTAYFNNSLRVSGHNNQFFRSAPQSQSDENTVTTGKHRIWLNLTAGQNFYKQMMIGYIENATNGLDWGYDGETFSTSATSLYSVLEDKTLSIQGRALPFDEEDEVPLGFKSAVVGTFTISIDHLDGLLTEQDIYLEDTELDVVHDLKASAYTFTTNPGTFNERFVLRYLPDSDLGNVAFDPAQKVIVAKMEEEIVVKSFSEDLKSVTVYDLLGRTILHKANIGNNEIHLENVVLQQQTLIVKVVLSNGMIVNKKLIY